jgi:hypothetical protein
MPYCLLLSAACAARSASKLFSAMPSRCRSPVSRKIADAVNAATLSTLGFRHDRLRRGRIRCLSQPSHDGLRCDGPHPACRVSEITGRNRRRYDDAHYEYVRVRVTATRLRLQFVQVAPSPGVSPRASHRPSSTTRESRSGPEGLAPWTGATVDVICRAGNERPARAEDYAAAPARCSATAAAIGCPVWLS